MKTISRIGVAAGAGIGGAVLFARSWTKRPARQFENLAHELTRALTRCSGLPEVLTAIESSFTCALGFPSAIFMPEGERLHVRHHSAQFDPDDSDIASAHLSISSGHLVVDRTSCYVSYFQPLITWRGTLGAFAFRATGTRAWIPRRVLALAQSYADQTSLAILRATLAGEALHGDLLADAERLQKALLNSIAHHVRSPLASIIGALSALQQEEIALNQAEHCDLIDTARAEAERLNRLVGNLLDVGRVQAGGLQVRKDPCDVQDVIGAALEQLSSGADNRPISVNVAPYLPFVPMDFTLIVQVLVNLLDNALKYSAVGSSIVVDASVLTGRLEVCVSDSGSGIAENDLLSVFDQFNRGGRGGETAGLGLGLSICKGIIEAHHGTIRAEHRRPHGTAVTFTLPV